MEIHPLVKFSKRSPARPYIVIGLSHNHGHASAEKILLHLALVDSGADACCAHDELSFNIGHDLKASPVETNVGIGGTTEGYRHECLMWVLPPLSSEQMRRLLLCPRLVERRVVERRKGVLGPFPLTVTFFRDRRPKEEGKTMLPYPILLGQEGFFSRFAFFEDAKKNIFAINPFASASGH